MVAAARVATALGAALAILTAIVVPTAVFYAAASGVNPVSRRASRRDDRTIVGGVGAGMFVFTTLMTLRGLLVFVLGAGAAARVAVALQVLTVLLLVEAFLFLPGILPGLLRPLMTPGAAEVTWMVPAWFLGLSVWVAGPHRDLLAVMAGRRGRRRGGGGDAGGGGLRAARAGHRATGDRGAHVGAHAWC